MTAILVVERWRGEVMTRRDRAVRHALDKLAIAERYARDARSVLAGESYDDRQIGAVLGPCAKCGERFYFVARSSVPVCSRCR